MNIKDEIKKLKKWQSFTLQEAKTFAENNSRFPYEEALAYCKGKREMSQDALKIINELMETVKIQQEAILFACNNYRDESGRDALEVSLRKSKQLLEGE